jgi:2',3'-cyclic-nucleotide 2'-phosphodiesterase (5'-nucleotidase family)
LALQYRAAALGNHDLDLGLETLRGFRSTSGLTFLAANLKDKAGAEQPLKLEPFTVIERGGIKVGVVGLTSGKTIGTTVAGRASGLELIPTEAALPPALAGVKKAGAEVVVVLVDDCFDTLSKSFEGHPEWSADLVVGSRCDGPNESKVRGIPFFSVGDDLSFYVSAAIELSGTGARSVKVARTELAPKGPEDVDMVALRERWQKKLDEHLGQVIGFSKAGVAQEAPQLRTWVATALRDETKSDAGLINRKGIRSELPKGPITKAHIYSMIPFENAVLTVKVTGETLEKLKANPEAVLVLPPGKLEKEKEYQLATTEYLYFGGDGLGLEAIAPHPELTGQVWQTPVIAWFERLQSSEKRPLEKLAK